MFGGFARLFFHGNYFTSSTATPYRIYSCHGNICGRKKKREKKGKVFRVDREITGFIIFSQLILSITNDRATAGTLKELVFVFEW